MDNFYLVLAYLVIGFLLRRQPAMPQNSGIVLNIYVLYVALPALILKNIKLLEFSFSLLIPAITPWLLLLVVVALVLLLSKFFNWSREVTGALLIILPLGNTSFLGFPMTEALFGNVAMPYAVVYDQIGSFIALATYVTIVAAIYSPTMNKPSAKAIIWKIISFPSFIALMVGLLIRDITLPPLAITLVDNLAATLVPVVMIAVGFQLSFRFNKDEIVPLLSALVIKLAVMPLSAWLIWRALGQEGLAVTISIFQAAMPPMISAGAIAIMAGLAPRLVSGVIGFGILSGLVSLPIVFWLLQ
ncbi:AEC family transporter [Alishewanella sp. 16-MA]|uniref:AEC family transporter n=1 Tax=Alishewanella maricola TaxID=2795740 RepID=A0ABS8C0P1_9ALTE|nr:MULTISPECIES: AEC family transporter [Alishewanella]MDP4946132.1 AEC family transporter [Alishewanella sp.]MDP5205981.1 AEC family transporter [Alishewanella sp. SMS9]MCB5225590.1 AEC family transporter [Alishewanella maricola]MDP5035717.1 AEC family transporter [Alishewanella sp.]MDP5187553.1 AEC family transporter [Alishewanella sp.]